MLATPALADCFLSGSTITCAPPGTGGYSDPAGDDLTVLVQPGTTVVDTGFAAIELRNRNVITNDGTIAAGNSAAGIYVNNDVTIWNNGAITAGTGGAGISGGRRDTVVNAGSIVVGDGAASYGIALGANGAVDSSGTISVGAGGTGIAVGSNSSLPAADSVTNSGRIDVGTFGTGINVVDNHRVLNSGTIAGDTIIGITAAGNNIITNTNTGMIGAGPSGIGVYFTGSDNALFNYGTIKAPGSNGLSIESCNCTTGNSFNNMPGGTLDGRLSVDGAGNGLTNSGLLTVTDPATPIGYPTFLVANQFGFGAGNTFTQGATGTLALRMDNTGAIDNLSADAIVPGGTVKLVLQPQLYQSQTFSGTAIGLTIYGALGLGHSIGAAFDRYTASSPFFTVTPLYDTNDPTNYQALSFQLDRTPFGSVPGMTDNQRAVGNALEAAYSPALDPNSTAGQFYINLFAAGSVGVLDQLSGAGTAAAQNASFGAAGQFNDLMMQRGLAWLSGAPGGGAAAPLGYAAAENGTGKPDSEAFAAMRPRMPRAPEWRAWALGFGSTRTIDAGAGTAGQSAQTAGGAFGVERVLGGDVLVGLAAGGSGSHFSASALSTSGRIDGGHVGAYAGKRWDDFYALAALNYARLDNSTDRTISGIGATENAHGRFASDQLGGRVEFGWRRRVAGYAVTPFVAIEPSALWQQGYSESSTTLGGGPGVLGLSYSAHETTSLPTFVGAQLDGQFLVGGQTVRPFLRAAWVHEFIPERQIDAAFVSIPSPSFTVDGARPARDAARMSGGATWVVDARTEIFARLDGELSGSGTMLAGAAGARIAW